MPTSFYYRNADTFFIFFNNGFLVFDTTSQGYSYFIGSIQGYPFTNTDFKRQIEYYIYFYPYGNFFQRLEIRIPDRHLLINHLVWPIDMDPKELQAVIRGKVSFQDYFLEKIFFEFSSQEEDTASALRDLVSQVFCLNVINTKHPLIVGESNTGKSVLLNSLAQLFGQRKLPKKDLIRKVSFTSLADKRNQKETAKLQECFLAVDSDVWFGTESPKALTGKFDNLKKLVGGDAVEGFLPQNPYFARVRELPTSCVLALASNKLPILLDVSGALQRRFIIIPARHKFLQKGQGSVEGKYEMDIQNDNNFFFKYALHCFLLTLSKPKLTRFTSNNIERTTSA